MQTQNYTKNLYYINKGTQGSWRKKILLCVLYINVVHKNERTVV